VGAGFQKWVQVFNLLNQEPCLENRRLKTCGHFGSAPQVEKKPAAKKVGAGFQPAQSGALPGEPQVKNLRPLWLGTAGRKKTCGQESGCRFSTCSTRSPAWRTAG
jgi:hypothetical protein